MASLESIFYFLFLFLERERDLVFLIIDLSRDDARFVRRRPIAAAKWPTFLVFLRTVAIRRAVLSEMFRGHFVTPAPGI